MGRNKALIPVDGTPMAARVAAALRAGGCRLVVAVGGDPSELGPLGLEVVADRHPGDGPLGGVITSLEHVAAHPAFAGADVFVAACDLPQLTGDDVASLIVAAAANPDAAVVVARSDRLEPGLAIWRQSALDLIRPSFAAGERAMHRAIAALDVAEQPVDARAVRNINVPDDLDR